MVLVEQQGEIENYRMLETIRQYAREKLDESQEAEQLKQRHLWFYVDMAEEAEPKLTGTQQQLWFKRLELEHDNLRGALAYALADERSVEAGLRLAAALWRFWWLHAHWSEGREWLARFVSKAEGQGASRALAKAINANGTLAFYQGDHSVARALSQESLRMRQRLDDREGIAASLNDLANVAYHSDGDYAAAQELYEASFAIRRELGDKWGTAVCLSNMGLVAMAKQDYEEADRLQSASLAIFQELGDTWRTAYGLSVLGDIAWFRRDYASARTLQAESVELYQESEDRWGTANTLCSLGEAERALHHYAEARHFYKESLTLSAELSSKFGIVYGIEGFAKLAVELGQVAHAARLFGMAEVLREKIQLPRPPSERLEYDRLLTAARTQVDAADLEASWAEGRELTTDQAIALALEQSG